jgi:hypothetical protein
MGTKPGNTPVVSAKTIAVPMNCIERFVVAAD